MARRFMNAGYAIHAAAVLLSAFLLFAVQPIAGKHLLPYFGGSSAVWATSLLFFTTILFVGYAYVYFVTRLSGSKQALVHGAILSLALVTTITAAVTWGSLFPPLEWMSGGTLSPTIAVLLALSMSIGVPYFLLSTTGPLVQYWYGTRESVEPYKLYALSNAGSLVALLAYPFAIEPFIPLFTQEALWALLFAVYALVCAAIVHGVRSTRAAHAATRPAIDYTTLRWIGFAALPSFMLVATTTAITQLISPVPLLWVVPLALYLITFIVAFAGRGSSIFVAFFTLIVGYLAYLYIPATPSEIVPYVFANLLLLYLCCLLCHARLYALRPETTSLPFFYLCTSFGGMVGALAASILAPLVFSDFWEFPLGLAMTGMVAGTLLSHEFFPRLIDTRTIQLIKVIFPFFVAALFVQTVVAQIDSNTVASRNFYGAVQLKFEQGYTVLQHGTTIHGLQPNDREWSYVPTTYYTQSSGIGRAIRTLRERGAGDMRLGVIGLGTGTLATYCEEGDEFVFYEIDPRIRDLARSHFSYLTRCAGSEVRIGDGRLLLQSERAAEEPRYDLLAVDAFTDDAIPAHLLTTEALSLYFDSIEEDGIIAIHTSNRYLALAPILLSITRDLGYAALVVGDSGDEGYMGSASQWVLLARDAATLEGDAFMAVPPYTVDGELPRPWTDTYTSLFSVIDVVVPWNFDF